MFSRFSRRHFFKIISFVIAGTTVAASVPLVGNFLATKAQAQETVEEVYKGRTYKIVTNETSQRLANTDANFDTSVQLFLDGIKVRIARNTNTQKYVTPLLFAEFNSPEEIAKQLIDLGIKLPSGEVKIDPNVD